MSAQAWVRYWIVGLAIGPVYVILGVADGDARMVFLGVALLFVAVGMIAFWRQRSGTGQDPN